MHRVRVSYIGFIRSLTGVRIEEIEFEQGTTVRELIRRLSGKYGDAFDHYVLSEGSRLSNLARLLVGGTEVMDLPEGYDTVIGDGCEVVIMTVAPLSGG